MRATLDVLYAHLTEHFHEKIIMMSDYRFASVIGIVGVVVGLIAFLFNYHFISYSMPGYGLFAAPAMFTLSFFSEETDFTPKMLLFTGGQFLGYFLLALIWRRLKEQWKSYESPL